MSIVASIVLYKHQQHDVEPTIQSLLAEDCLKRLILVDNSNCEWAKNYKHPKVNYIKSSGNHGYGHGHNQAIMAYATEADFTLICNPDIEFSPGTLGSLLATAKDRPEGLFMPAIRYPNLQRQEVCRLLPTPVDLILRRFIPVIATITDKKYLLKTANFDEDFFAPSLSGSFMLFRSQALLQLGGFDERFFMYMEDVDLSRRAAIAYGTRYISTAHVTHTFQKASYKKIGMLVRHMTSAIKYFNKWGWFFDQQRRTLNNKCLSELPRNTAK